MERSEDYASRNRAIVLPYTGNALAQSVLMEMLELLLWSSTVNTTVGARNVSQRICSSEWVVDRLDHNSSLSFLD